MSGSPEAGAVDIRTASALAALELRAEGVVGGRAARPGARWARAGLALDPDDDAGALGQAVLHLDVLPVGDAEPHPHRLGLALVVEHEHEAGAAAASGTRGRRRRGARLSAGPPEAAAPWTPAARSRRARPGGDGRPGPTGPGPRAGAGRRCAGPCAAAAGLEALGPEAQRRGRDPKHVVRLLHDHGDRGGHAGHELAVVVVDADDRVVGDDVLDGGGLQPHLVDPPPE